MPELSEDLKLLLTQYGIKTVGVFVLLFVAYIVAGWAGRITRRACDKAKIDITLGKFFGKMIRWAILLLAVLAALGMFGVNTTSFAAVLAAMGLAVGLALQGTLANFAAGVMLLIFRPFKVGDVVSVSGVTGKVDEISLFTTTLDTPDNRRFILPNGSVFGANIENISFHSRRRVDVEVGTDYGANIAQTRSVLQDAANALPQRLPDEDAAIVLAGLGGSSIDWSVRVWVNADDFWPAKDALTHSVKDALDNAQIGIPFPQMDVHVDGAMQSA